MATTKNKKPVSRKTNGSKNFANRLKKPQLLIFITLFALVGVYFLLRSFAAVGSVGMFTDVYMPGNNYFNMDHNLTIHEVSNLGSAPYFWSRQFGFSNGSGGGGAYIGLQGTNKAVFSVFGSSTSSTPGCSVEGSGFDGGTGSGTACIKNYVLTQGHTYTLRVWSDGDDGTWRTWGAWVIDTTTGQEMEIGHIKVPSSWGGLNSSAGTWTEFFGGAISRCSDLPHAKVTFSNFSGNAGQYTTPTRLESRADQNDCSAGSKITTNGPNSYTHEAGIGYVEPNYPYSQPQTSTPPNKSLIPSLSLTKPRATPASTGTSTTCKTKLLGKCIAK